MSRAGIIALIFVASTVGHAQDIKSYDKKGEREKFNSKGPKGMSPVERSLSYSRRLAAELESPFAGILWRNVGPEIQSGRVLNIVAPESKPNEVLVSFATGGLFRTDDDGQTWTSLWDNQSAFSIGDFDVSKDGKTIYVGTGEANSQRTSYSGTGVYKSTDAGKTWSFSGLPDSHHIARVMIDPKNENTVWVATLGHLYTNNDERGLYRSDDAGKTWQQVLGRGNATGVVDFAQHPKNGNILIASAYERDRKAWNYLESGPGSEVLRTENGGKSWSSVKGLPSGNALGRTGLAWSESDEKVVYAFVDNQGKNEDWLIDDERTPNNRITPRRFARIAEEAFLTIDKVVLSKFWDSYAPKDLKLDDALTAVKDKKMTMAEIRAKIETRVAGAFEFGGNSDQIYRSDDGGKSFKLIQKLGQIGGYYYERVFVNPKDANDVWLCGVPMVRSTDGGKTWISATGKSDVHVDHHAVWFDPKNPGKIWIGNDGGIYLTRNDGKNWTHFENLSVGQTTTVAVDNKLPYNIFTGLQDNGTMKGSSIYKPGISSPSDWTDVGGGDGSAIAIDPRTDLDLIYVASQFGAHSAFEQKTGVRYGASPRPVAGEASRANWISPIVISGFHNDIVYVGYNRLYRSFDRGRSYKPISPDLTRNRPNGDVPHSSLKDISESPLRFGLIYCGSDDGRVTMTPDGGVTWNEIPTPQPEKWVSRIVASRYDEKVVYCSQSGFREDDFSAYLWKSSDQGKTWKSIVGNLPAETINVVREDSKNKDILYVGTDMGVFVTFNGGDTWESLHGGMGHLPVHDMVIQERDYDLVIATHARGCFVLPLKTVTSITPELRKAEITIVEAKDVIAGDWGYESRAKFSSEDRPQNLKLSFFAKSAGKTQVQILSADGKAVVTTVVVALKGFNSVEVPLLLTPSTKVVETMPTGNDVTKDPYEQYRAKYVAKGNYTLQITQGAAKVTKAWKID
jgi:photosystem II stability/assembly factor-like uncharacterized protein